MTDYATFCLTRNGNVLLEVQLGTSSASQSTIIDVYESQEYGMEIRNREDDTEYRVRIGDVPAESCGDGDNTPRARGKNVEWFDARFFDGAHGQVLLRVSSRLKGSEAWSDRTAVPADVKSSKLTDERYETMFEQLRMLAANIVFDLVSKTMRSISFDARSSTPFIRTSLLELRVIQQLWPTLSSCIHLMESQAAKTIRREYVRRRCLGGEYLDARALRSLALTGVNPKNDRHGAFTATVARLVETSDLPENRMVKGFLEFLLSRIRDCQMAISQQIAGLEQHRHWRSTRFQNNPSLFEVEDRPKIQRLEHYHKSADHTFVQIKRALSGSFLKDLPGQLDIVTSPHVRNVVPYRAFVQLMLEYLSTGILILDDPYDERIKSTHRLYEQWVFLQIVSAIQKLGLTCFEQHGLLNKSKSHRFTLDFDRGARVVFGAGGGRHLSVRYEPWVLPKDLAISSQESVFRSGGGSAWSPDILIELLPQPDNSESLPSCSFSIVIDAKYSPRIKEHHWESVGKYSQIRATASGAQVGKQLWIAYPGQPNDDDSFPVEMRDSSVNWTVDGPDRPYEENLEGTILLRPAKSIVFDGESNNWIGRPEPSAIEFVDGILSYLGIEHSARADEQRV